MNCLLRPVSRVPLFLAAATAAFLLAPTGQVLGGSGTWTGAQGNQWQDVGNWDVTSGSGHPHDWSDVATFGSGPTQHSVVINEHTHILRAEFTSGAPGYTIGSSNGQIRIAADGGVTVDGGVPSDQAFTVTVRPRIGTTTYSNDGTGLLSFSAIQTDWDAAGNAHVVFGGSGSIQVNQLQDRTPPGHPTDPVRTLSVEKIGSGTLTLTGASSYSGTTTLGGGTLRLTGGDNRLLTTGTLHFDGASTLDLDGVSQTMSQVTFASGASAAITGSGGSLTVNGAQHVQIGAVGAAPQAAVALDMAGLDNFVYNSPGNFFRVGLQSGSSGGYGSGTTVATATLADTNTITASQLLVADQVASSGGGQSFLYLGRENTIHANTIGIAANGRSNGTLQFAGGLTDPSATFRGTNGTSPVANWNIGRVANFTNNTWTATVDFSGGSIDALVTTMTLGDASTGGSATRAGTSNATFLMGAGTMEVGTLNLGRVTGGGSLRQDGDGGHAGGFSGNGTFHINHPDAQFTAGNIHLATMNHTATGGNPAPSTTGLFHLENGTATVTGGIVLGSNTTTQSFGAVSATLRQSGGTLQAGTLALAPTAGTTGTVDLSGGVLKAQSITGGAGTAAFHWTGGQLSVDHFGFDLLQTSVEGPSILAPGRSVGMTAIDGNYTMDTGTLEIEINGYDQGDQGLVGAAGDGVGYDFVLVDGNASLTGTLDVLLVDGFLPNLGDHFDVLQTTGDLSYDLSLTGDLPSPTFGWWELGQVPGPGGDGFLLRLSAVPEPSSAVLLLLGLIGLLGRRRRRR